MHLCSTHHMAFGLLEPRDAINGHGDASHFVHVREVVHSLG